MPPAEKAKRVRNLLLKADKLAFQYGDDLQNWQPKKTHFPGQTRKFFLLLNKTVLPLTQNDE